MEPVNGLQQFMTTCFAQASAHVQEAATVNGQPVYGTFGDPQLQPIMTRQGSQNLLVTSFQVARNYFAFPPEAFGSVGRPLTGQTYFVQIVDNKNPVVFTFVLTDREL